MNKNKSATTCILALAGIGLSLAFGRPARAVEISWGPEQVVTSTADSARVAVPVDVDGDGDLDLVISSLLDDTLAWFRNTDGQGSFALGQTITTTDGGAVSVSAADVDHDGDLDLIAPLNDSVVWYENTDGLGTFVFNQNVAPVVSAPTSVIAADIDGDGDHDVVVAGQNDDTVSWWKNDGVGAFTLGAVLTTTADGAQTVFAADVDNDGDLDVLAASSLDNTVSWFDNTNGQGTSWTANPITTTATGATAVFAADIDRDGDLDVFSTAQTDGTIMWHENTDGQGTFVLGQVITTTADGVRSLFGADMDSDGDPDVVSSSIGDDTIAWYENTDGAGAFGSILTITSAADAAFSATPADLDGDGDLDVAAASFNDDTVAWFENETIHSTGAWSRAGEITTTAQLALFAFAADVDGDGDLDALSASFGDDTVAWYENTDGQGSFGPKQTITTTASFANSVFAADVDGDGDMDALSTSIGDATVAWYENTDGLGSFGPNQIITAAADGVNSVFAADVDGDGDVDALSAASGDATVAWFENTDGLGNFGPAQTITTTADSVRSVFAADVDGDGDVDALSASFGDDTVAWYENTDGLGSFGPLQIITTAANGADSVFAADVDGDGDVDALSASVLDATVAWYENTDGLGSFGPKQIITTAADGAESVFAADVDGDGDVDALSASSLDDTVAWYENTDGLGNFGPEQTITITADGARSVFVADVDGDGDVDVLSASFGDDTVAWYENTDGLGSFGAEPTITTTAGFAESVFAADVDGDGDVDALSASESDNTIAWYENTDGLGNFGPEQTITTTADGALSVVAADVDGDGDMDALSASQFDDTVAWYENTDGLGNFGLKRTITTTANSAQSVFAADVDGDGDVDALSASAGGNPVAWYENTNGLGSFGPQQTITTAVDGAASVFAADMDGDGDVDALSASANDDTVAWYENTDGLGSFGPKQTITTTAIAARCVFAADVDGDGDADVLSASALDATVAWYENTDGLGSFGPQQTITTTADTPVSVFAADVDGDGDLDALSASFFDDIAWYENTDGLGSFGPKQTITTTGHGWTSVFAADLDGDGHVEALSANRVDDTIAWHENRSGQAVFTTTTAVPAHSFQGAQVEILRVGVSHLGRVGDADAEFGKLVLQLETAPGQPAPSNGVRPLTSAEANALIENLLVYRDDGSGEFETGSDALFATQASLVLTKGIQTVVLPNAEPDAQIIAGETALFFVVAEMSATAGMANPKSFRARHLSSQSEVQHTATSIVLAQAPGTGTQPLSTTVFDPAADDDGDGLTNGDEVNTHGSDPLDADTDNDGLSDGDEINTYASNPLVQDTDGDGLDDGDEVNTYATNPAIVDTDGDGLSDGDEVNTYATNPTISDTDGDGLSDGDEVNTYLTDPLVDGDADSDGISDAVEIAGSLNPNSNDTDGDGFLDGLDNCPSAYNPFQSDQGGFGTIIPDGVGDVCQNGDFNGDGVVDILDITFQRRGLADLEPDLDPSMPPMQPAQ